MKQLSSELQDHLNSGTTTLCWCWRIERYDGLVQGFTDHDRDLEFDGTSYKASTGFSGTELTDSLGLNVNSLDVDGALQSDSLAEEDLSAGLYDNASVKLFRVNWQDVNQRVLMRTGSIGEVRRGQNSFTAEIRGLAHKLQQPKGRLYQYNCDADLGDGRCKVDLSDPAYRADGTIASIEDNRCLTVSALESYSEDWFSRGVVTITSGENSGQSREVKSHRVNDSLVILELWQPFIKALNIGASFSVTAGCDKSFSTCKAKFSNGVNFRGFPHMPGNDFVMSYPNSDDGNHNGQSLQK